jgi:hypothetical protein
LRADYENHKHVREIDARMEYERALTLNTAIDQTGLSEVARELEAYLRRKYSAYLPQPPKDPH